MLVHGVSGMGKSALVRCFANELIRGEEAVVLRGRCYERETVPYKAFDNIIDALSRYLMGLPTEEAAQMLPRNVHSLTVLFPVLKRVKAISCARTTQAPDLRRARAAQPGLRRAQGSAAAHHRPSPAGHQHRRPAVGRHGQRALARRS